MLNFKLKIALIVFLVFIAAASIFKITSALVKNIGDTFTITATCSDVNGNLTQCAVTSPCTNTCAASGSSGSCQCTFTCTTAGTYNANAQAVDSLGLTGSTSSIGTVVCGCNLNRTGDYTVTFPCQLNGSNHLQSGNLTVGSGGSIQINPNSSLIFDTGKQINISGGGYILISSTNASIQKQ